MSTSGSFLYTPHGPARVELHRATAGRAWLLLGHGAGGSLEAPDLIAARLGALAAGVHVALVEQPYRVAGRRLPPSAGQLDTAWLTVVEALRASELAGLPLIFGGRSSGARVACRTSAEGEAHAVLCLAFPLRPPGKPEKTRRAELDDVRAPTLVIQGEADPFGRPGLTAGRELVLLRGNHSLKADLEGVRNWVHDWLSQIVPPT
ncbi:MAG: alpha/beta hydrolase family protein, partial [Pseudonocardiaceae bacterium]